MSKKTTSTVTSIGLGMVIGGVGAALGSTMMNKSGTSPVKKKAAKALQSMENMLQGIQTMMR